MTNGVAISDPRTLSLSEIFRISGVPRRFDPGATIAAQGEAQEWVYRVARGVVRSCVYSPDGHRRILGFRRPGSILGLGVREAWVTSEEAVDTVVLEAVSVAALDALLSRSPVAQADLRARLAGEIEAHAALLVLTSSSSAVDRVRTFLTEFAQSRKAGGFVALPMSRRDIADHLGLSMESVCRSISALRRDGEIDLRGAGFFRLAGASGQTGVSRAA